MKGIRMAKKDKTFLDDILEQFGDTVLEGHDRKIEPISTGCLSLNTSIGVGGIPKGKITTMFGPEGSGKTTIALNTSKQVANAGNRVLYVDVENLLNKSLLKAVLGEDTNVDNIIIVTPDSAEDAFIIAEKGISSGEFELVVIDSIGSMASRKEKEVDFDKDTMGQLPRLVGRFIKRNVFTIRIENVAVLILNQVRDNVGSYVKSYKMPGGHQLYHESSVIISLTKGDKITRGKEIVGILTKFTVLKNKLAPPLRSFTIPILFGQGIDYYSDLIDFTKLLGVITSSGPYYKFGDEALGKGRVEVRENLIADKELLDRIEEKVYNTVNYTTNISEILNDIDEEFSDTPLID
jgi:recombination protein RecA